MRMQKLKKNCCKRSSENQGDKNVRMLKYYCKGKGANRDIDDNQCFGSCTINTGPKNIFSTTRQGGSKQKVLVAKVALKLKFQSPN